MRARSASSSASHCCSTCSAFVSMGRSVAWVSVDCCICNYCRYNRCMASDIPVTPQGCTNFKLRQLARLVAQRSEPHFADSGLKMTQYSLLSHVEKLGPLAPGALARRMDLDASTLSRNLQPLLADGWIELLPGTDARSRTVQVTPAGRSKRAEMKADWKRAQLAVNAALGDERVQRLHALVDECMAALRSADAGGG